MVARRQRARGAGRVAVFDLPRRFHPADLTGWVADAVEPLAPAASLVGVVVLLPAAVSGAPDARDFGAVFSPDGGTVAFVHAVGGAGSIDLIGRDGSDRRTLVPRVLAQHLAWSPDGNSVAYDSGASIWRVDLATRTPVC